MRSLNSYSTSIGRDLNHGPFEYQARVLLTAWRCSMLKELRDLEEVCNVTLSIIQTERTLLSTTCLVTQLTHVAFKSCPVIVMDMSLYAF
jgi:hypothetical protein